MRENEDSMLEPVIQELRRSVRFATSFDARVMSAIRVVARREGHTAPVRLALPKWRVWTAFAAVAAGVLAVALFPSSYGTRPQRVQFVLVAPDAKTVKVVGDFNGWDTTHPAFNASNRGGGVWSVTAPVAPGYHRYAFLVDDSLWVTDPTASRVADDSLGLPNSAIVVDQYR